MEFPVLLSCGHWNMLDTDKLERRPLSDLMTVTGISCQICKMWKPWYYSTRQLDESMRKLRLMPPDHASFWYYFVKTRKRAEEIQRRGRNIANGAFQYPHMASN